MGRASHRALATPALALLLFAGTFGVYARVASHSFVSLDDDAFIFQNAALTRGLSWAGLRWAFTTGLHGNWTPVTWLSLLADFELHGLAPRGYLLENAGLHATASALLFLALLRMTRATGRSLVVAALFALHPLHVESVAWAAERKDVLSGVFFSWALLAHARACELPTFARRSATVCASAAGLLAKPMLVTLPFVLLLLDYWPLGRLCDRRERTRTVDPERMRAAIVEKLPIFVLAAGISVLTFLAQQEAGAVASLDLLPFHVRAANALISYTEYLVQAVWPSRLAVFYPLIPSQLAPWKVAGAALFLAGATALCIRERRRRPYAIVGWLWYLGMLIPVIGFVQVGLQARADRYTYLPLIGIFLGTVFGTTELAERWPRLRPALPALAAAVIVALAGATLHQLEFWRGSVPLFEHALAVTERNFIVHNALGKALGLEGRDEEAIAHYEEALRLRPEFAEGQFNLGNRLARVGREEDAIRHYEEALRLAPGFVDAHFNLGNHLGRVGRVEEAMAHYKEALRLQPDFAAAHDHLGNLLASLGRTQEAFAEWRETLRIEPKFADAHYHLGSYLASQGREDEAISHYEEALRLNPGFAEGHQSLAEVLARRGRTREAIAHYEEALRLRPALAGAARDLAWLRATDPEASNRDGGEAVQLALQALVLDGMDPTGLDTLAAAYAEAGQFSQAIRAAERALDLVRAEGNAALAGEIETRLALYRAGRPFHQDGPPKGPSSR
jgi:tetratricopeptide (TPR) repeat protein